MENHCEEKNSQFVNRSVPAGPGCVVLFQFNGDGKARADQPDVNWVTLLKKMKDLPEGEYVKVDSPDAKISIKRAGGLFLIHVDEQKDEKTTVDVRLPVALLDAVSVDENQELDVKAFVAQLDKLETGDLVRVSGDDADVRIWVE